ncbi:MAG: 2Fe-2S iron-sulfur cluster-binding protein [Gemmatimonadetes bacterium]|nr:2Fe-2S iron-sulfur cluster-binding protein [Gemmatimonadota bacterium]MDA1103830.1 2Fe-2S iron-sulfur cluster-binding protein [Gemmatimonadota bacterium]
MAELIKLTIDGHDVAVPRGTTILEAAKTIGAEVPHYCYHPGMSSPAMCRLCLVDVEGAPKPMPGCVTTVMEGQTVHTQSEKARKNRQGVLEFYLVNHPLDCPICDMSGECNLQDYVHDEGREQGRGREPKRVFGRDDFGGDVLFYGDRCVMCTRCVRFMSEVEQDHRLTVVERGDRSIIDTFFDEGLDGTNWHGNIVDICPVGALVSKDFLHKARAWDLEHTPSVCTSCSQGCNIDLHTRDNLVQRIKPRENLDVNAWWMCDHGRHNYEWMNHGDRIEAPLVREDSGSRAVDWKSSLSSILARAGELGNQPVKAVASPFSSNEDLGALAQLVGALGGGETTFRSSRAEAEVPLKGFPTLVRRRDLAPNRNGAELIGFKRVGNDDGFGGLDKVAEHDGILIVLGDALVDQTPDFGSKASLYIYLGTHDSPAARNAHLVLPVTTHAEHEGTFTNHEGRVQRFWPALQPPGMARPAWLVLGALVGELTERSGPRKATDAFSSLSGAVSAFGGITYDDIGTRGAVVNESVSLTGD